MPSSCSVYNVDCMVGETTSLGDLHKPHAFTDKQGEMDFIKTENEHVFL